jgi:hypothetical protein
MPVKVTVDKVQSVLDALQVLNQTRVMVGIPGEKAARRGTPITNAALGYIHENGAPEINLPARPFLVPGVSKVKTQTASLLRQAGVAALDGKPTVVRKIYMAAGQTAVNSVTAVIRAGIPPPLKPGTVARRRVRSRGSNYRRKATTAAQTIPLIDTGQLLRSVTYVLRVR